MPKRTKSQSKGIPPPAVERIWLPARGESDVRAISTAIAEAVHGLFDYMTTSKGHGGGGVTAARPGEGQWTVVAGFVVLQDVERTTDGPGGARTAGCGESGEIDGTGRPGADLWDKSFEKGNGSWVDMTICSLASGVKCLGGSLPSAPPISITSTGTNTPNHEPRIPTPEARPIWSDRDSQLVDMHAEILARRELETLLVHEARLLIARHKGATLQMDEVGGMEPIILELVVPPPTESRITIEAQKPWFRVKEGTQLVLYTSHAPCGAASDAAHIRRLDAEDGSIRAFLAGLGLHLPPAREEEISAFREGKSRDVPEVVKKPSRGDAVPTEAYSCSDKLGRAHWLGFQGGRLAKLMDAEGPVRLSGLIVGEDYEEDCLRKIFGRGEGYSRVGEVERVMQGKEGSGRRWLEGLITGEPCRIWESTRRFAHGRESSTPSTSVTPRIPANVEWNEIRHLPLPLLRDILLPSSAPTPFPVALAWHAHSTPQAIGPNGRLSGVTRDKRTKAWAENSVARVARGRMWDAYEELVRDYESAFGLLEGGVGKGGPGWREVSTWMEECGPYAGWHARP